MALADVDRAVRLRLAVAAVVLAAAACLPRTTPAPMVTMDETWVYTCSPSFQFGARVMPEVVSLRLPTRTTAMPRVGASTGTRYAAGDVELTRRGETATLRIGSERYSDCTGQRAETPWAEARLLGAEFRAVGREPVWNLEIDDDGRRARFLLEGSSEIYLPLNETERVGSAISYQAVSDGHSLGITIDAQPCPNAMLGQGLTHTVRLAVDGFPYVGCGRMLGSAGGG